MSNIEIEIRVKINNSNNRLAAWLKNNGVFVSEEEQKDIYFESTENSFLYTDKEGKKQADKWLRVRSSKKENSVCYKLVHRDKSGNFIYADEYETQVDNPEVMVNMFKCLNYEKLCSVVKKRTLWKYSNYYICIDHVLELGDFVEIEIIDSLKSMDIEKEKREMIDFIKYISNSEVDKIEGGYPWLLMQKK